MVRPGHCPHTPILLELFSWITLAAHALQKRHPMTQRKAGWYDKPLPTFVDAIALVATPTVAGVGGFFTVGGQPRYAGLSVARYHRLVDFPGLRRLKCGKSSFHLGYLFHLTTFSNVSAAPPSSIADDATTFGWVNSISAFLHILLSAMTHILTGPGRYLGWSPGSDR